MAILVDINGTLASEGKPIWPVVNHIKSLPDDIYLISGSSVKKKKDYEKLMKRLEISYVDLILNPLDENTDLTFKGRMAKTIPNLTLAIDNNKKILAMYASMGINAIHPDDL
jgi:hypothetical protein